MNDRPAVLITGASRGIGRETAIAFARCGYDCALLSNEESALNELAQEIDALGVRTLVYSGDVSNLDFAHDSVAQIVHNWGRMDVLINNAAWREIVTMRQIERSSWERTLQVCLTAPAFLARWCAESMEAAGRGVILNISSIQSRFPAGLSPAYTAAKGGLDALTYELAALYGPVGIRVLSVNLGAIDTELSRGYGTSTVDDQLRSYLEAMIPLQRYGRASEVAKTLTMLAGESASYLTGTCVELDGGWCHQGTPYSVKQMLFPREFHVKEH